VWTRLVKITGARGQPILHMFLSFSVVSFFCRLYSFKPSPTYTATGNHAFKYSVKRLATRSLVGSRKHFFTGARTRCRRSCELSRDCHQAGWCSITPWTRGAQIPGRFKLVRWQLTFVDPQYGTCYMSSLCRLEF